MHIMAIVIEFGPIQKQQIPVGRADGLFTIASDRRRLDDEGLDDRLDVCSRPSYRWRSDCPLAHLVAVAHQEREEPDQDRCPLWARWDGPIAHCLETGVDRGPAFMDEAAELSRADRNEAVQPSDAADNASLPVIVVVSDREAVDMRKDDLEAPADLILISPEAEGRNRPLELHVALSVVFSQNRPVIRDVPQSGAVH
jgi:hypothetical protein